MYKRQRYYIEETGALGEVPASLQNYIDYQAYGRDLDLSGTFISTNHGTVSYTHLDVYKRQDMYGS